MTFKQVVEIPEDAKNIQFHEKGLPEKYQEALQNVK